MPSILYTRTRPNAFNGSVLVERKNLVWYHSPKKGEKLMLRDNPFSRQNVRTVQYLLLPSNKGSASYVPGSPPYSVSARPEYKAAMQRLEAESYARLRGRLYKGSAALGVTIGSWKQSREMIVTRYRQMSMQADRFEQRARRIIDIEVIDRKTGKHRNRYKLKALADQYLELVFGWKPLLSDIHAAASTVVNAQPQAQRVSATARTHLEMNWKTGDALCDTYHRVNGVVRHARGVTVEISNPNLWLAERAGLNNPAAVAWDLVPFSFVVNMFVNTGSLVNSLTDFAGLVFPTSVAVSAHDLTYDCSVTQKVVTKPPYGGRSSFQLEDKFQKLGGVGRPPMILKLPNASFELAGIAASLFIQKFRVLQVLVGSTRSRN